VRVAAINATFTFGDWICAMADKTAVVDEWRKTSWQAITVTSIFDR
jgi:hypothetical protein